MKKSTIKTKQEQAANDNSWRARRDATLDKYQDSGLHIVCLKPRGKEPYQNGWPKKPASPEVFPANDNVGIVWGKKSNDLVDIDHDWSEFGNWFTLPRAAAFGRGGRITHVVVKCVGAKTKKFVLPASCVEPLTGKSPDDLSSEDKKHLLCVAEIRSAGCQTMVPPSIHPNGEELEWLVGGPESLDAVSVDAEELNREVGIAAFLSVCERLYPAEGARDEFCMAVAGALVRAGLDGEEIDDILEGLANIADDEEAPSRRKGTATKEALEKDEPITGLPRVCELLGLPADVVKTFRRWLGSSVVEDKRIHPRPELSGIFERLNEQFFLVNESGAVMVCQEHPTRGVVRMKLQEFKLLTATEQVSLGGGKRTPVAELWISSPVRREYPHGFQLVANPAKVDLKAYNLWRGYAVEPRDGDCTLFKQHLRDIICRGDDDLFDYLWRYLAWCVQHPDQRSEVAIVIHGRKGCGKSVVIRTLLDLFDPAHTYHASSRDELTGTFNEHLESVVLFYSDEALFPGDPRDEGVLKRLITEPTISIHPKYFKRYMAPNRLTVLMSSNEDWAVPATMDERRFFALRCDDKYSALADPSVRRAYFDLLVREIDEGGREALLRGLLQTDVDGWHPRDHVPKTEALNANAMHRLRGPEQVAYDLLYEATLPFNKVDNPGRDQRRSICTDRLRQHVLVRYPGERGVGLNKVIQYLKDNLGVRQDNNGRLFDGYGEDDCLKYKRARRLIFPELGECRKQLFQEVPWGDEFTTWQTDESEEWD